MAIKIFSQMINDDHMAIEIFSKMPHNQMANEIFPWICNSKNAILKVHRLVMTIKLLKYFNPCAMATWLVRCFHCCPMAIRLD